MSHSYQIYFGFLGSNLNLDCGLRDHKVRITVVLGFLIFHGQLMKKISLFYTYQFSFLPRNQNIIKYHHPLFPCVARMNKESL